MKKLFYALATVAAAMVAFSCTPEPVAVESVSVNPTTLSMKVGETQTVTATVKPENADDKTVVWSSSDNNVATVDPNGLVSAVASGSATITAETKDGQFKATCAVTVSLKDALYSFTSRTYMMSEHANVEVNLVNPDGSAYVAEEEIVIPVKVNGEKSTAVEGENFKFAGEKNVVIGVGKSKGTVVLDCEKQEEGKDIVVLDFDVPASAAYLIAGQYTSTKVTIFGAYADKIKGTWVMDELVTDATFMDEVWYGMFSMEGFPTFNSEDRMTFDDNGLTTDFKSELKNFFREQSDVTLGTEMQLHANITSFHDIRTVQLLWLSNVNRYFSPNEVSEDTEACIGVRINDEGLLEVFLIDCEYKSFFVEYGDWGYNPEKPYIGDSSNSYIIFNMRRAE